MSDYAILYIGTLSYGDGIDIASEYCTVPNVCVLSQSDVSQDNGSGGDEGSSFENRLFLKMKRKPFRELHKLQVRTGA
jgi:hypothetical protein